MKSTKKLFVTTLVAAGSLLVGCSIFNFNNNDDSSISWKSDWSYDEHYHWHESTDANYGYVKDKGAHNFDNGVVSKEPTEQETGLLTYTCTICGFSKTEVIDKKDHEHHLNEGYEHDEHYHWQTCSGCDEKFYLTPHSGGHATCSELAICDVCHEHYGEYAEHNYGDLVEAVDPTCTTEGHEAYYYCSECGKYFDIYREETTLEELRIPISEHFGELIERTEPTCEEVGLEAHYHCDICDKYLDANKHEATLESLTIPAKGHDYGDLIPEVPSTCEEDGIAAHYHCSVCDKYFNKNKEEVSYAELTLLAGHKFDIHHHDAATSWDECKDCHELTKRVPHTWNIGEASSGSRVDVNQLGDTRNVSIWDGTSASTSLSGAGSEIDPYLINNAADLAYFASSVSGGEIYTSKYIKLNVSVDLSNHPLTIGGYAAGVSFAGTFDGNNNFILGMKLTISEASNGNNVLGLFPTTAATSVVKNLIVDGDVSGAGAVGGISGYINGTIQNCYNFATVTATGQNAGGLVGGTYNVNAKIIDSYNFGEVNASHATSNAGGIIGMFKGTVSNCQNYGIINAKTTAGGIAGAGYGVISNTTNYGEVNTPNGYSAGIVGVTNTKTSTLTNCVNNGDINSKLYSGGIIGTVNHKEGDVLSNCVNKGKIICDGNCIGGIIGAPISFDTSYTASLTNCVNNGLVKGGNRVGSIVGWFPGATYSNCENKGTIMDFASYWDNDDIHHELANKKEFNWENGEIIDGTRIDTNEFGFTRTVSIWDGSSKSTSLSGSGTSSSPYLIKNASDLAYFADSVSGGEIYSSKYVKMMASVDLNNHPLMIGGFNADVSFAGTFDGNNNFVLNMNLSSSQSTNGLGLFCTNASTSVIKNLAVDGVVSGATGVGGIAGFINGAIENSYNFATISASTRYAGGIVGGTYTPKSVINCCYNFGDIISTPETAAGIIGFFRGSVNDSTNYGTIDTKINTGSIAGDGYGKLSNVANLGTVIGSSHTGGVLGVVRGATSITNAYNNGTVISGAYTGGIAGTIAAKNVEIIFTNCVNNGEVKSLSNGIGGIIGSSLTQGVPEYAVQLLNCVNNGLVKGNDRVGGIAGQAYGTYSNCVNNGTVSAVGTNHGDLFGFGDMSEI